MPTMLPVKTANTLSRPTHTTTPRAKIDGIKISGGVRQEIVRAMYQANTIGVERIHEKPCDDLQ